MSAKVDHRPSGSAAPDKLAPHVFAELAAIVGPRFVSQDDHVMASHDWFGLGADPSCKTLLGKPPAAVVLPATTEEVAAIVKACNRHGVRFKAHSTGYGNYAGVATKGSVSIDLRRMDRIEILPEDRMAIIEPYATAGRLMAEANKHRLMTHMIGAGPIHSPLASATSFAGMSVAGNHTGNNSRNLLAAEWVSRGRNRQDRQLREPSWLVHRRGTWARLSRHCPGHQRGRRGAGRIHPDWLQALSMGWAGEN